MTKRSNYWAIPSDYQMLTQRQFAALMYLVDQSKLFKRIPTIKDVSAFSKVTDKTTRKWFRIFRDFGFVELNGTQVARVVVDPFGRRPSQDHPNIHLAMLEFRQSKMKVKSYDRRRAA